MSEALQYNQIPKTILKTIDLPQGVIYPDLTKISEIIAQNLNLDNLLIRTDKSKWLTLDEVEKLLDEDMYQLSFSLSPLEGNLSLLMPTDEISKLTTSVMTKDENAKPFSSEILQEGFFQYVILEIMDAVNKDEHMHEFSLKMLSSPTKLNDIALCIDISATYHSKSIYAKLLVTPLLIENWKTYFFNKPNYLMSKISHAENFFLSINVGNVDLNYESFKQISVGDFVILDHSFYDPKTHQGSVLLTFDNEPIYQGKIKQDNITILDFAKLKEDYMEDTEKNTPIKDVPLSIQVEMGKIEMSLEKLTSLKPGEVIETTISPNNNVSLILNNKKIAKAELVKVGEIIGVRVLEIS